MGGGAPMQPSVLIDGHRVLSWNAYVLLWRCSGRGSSGKGELHVRWMCVEVVAGAVVAVVVAVVVSWNADFVLL